MKAVAVTMPCSSSSPLLAVRQRNRFSVARFAPRLFYVLFPPRDRFLDVLRSTHVLSGLCLAFVAQFPCVFSIHGGFVHGFVVPLVECMCFSVTVGVFTPARTWPICFRHCAFCGLMCFFMEMRMVVHWCMLVCGAILWSILGVGSPLEFHDVLSTFSLTRRVRNCKSIVGVASVDAS